MSSGTRLKPICGGRAYDNWRVVFANLAQAVCSEHRHREAQAIAPTTLLIQLLWRNSFTFASAGPMTFCLIEEINSSMLSYSYVF
jgi:hypothetical protein